MMLKQLLCAIYFVNLSLAAYKFHLEGNTGHEIVKIYQRNQPVIDLGDEGVEDGGVTVTVEEEDVIIYFVNDGEDDDPDSGGYDSSVDYDELWTDSEAYDVFFTYTRSDAFG